MSKNGIDGRIERRELPVINCSSNEQGDIAPFKSVEELVSHDSMRVYYDVTNSGDSNYSLPELDTTLARAELLRPLFDQLFKNYGPDATVLDIACSPGYFMFKMAQAGFVNIHGVDARPEHRAQFNFLKDKYGYDGITFELSDVYEFLDREIAEGKKYDICLFFGFLYHTSTPVELLQKIRKICKKCLVIDTTLSHREDTSLSIFEEPTEWSRASTSKISFLPSLRSVPKLLEAAGFSREERIYPDERFKSLNPGGDNIDYFFDHDNISKLSSFYWRIISAYGHKLGLKKKRGCRRAFFCAYP